MKTMKWLLKREFWEHKGAFFWAPIVAAGVMFIFLLVTLAFILFQRVIAKQFGLSAELRAMDRAARRRNWTALIAYTLAIPAAYLHPAISLVMIGGVAVLYFVPDALKRTISRHD